MLLLHGNPTWSFLWRKVIAALPPRRFRSIAPDLLGFGLSDKLQRPDDHRLVRHLDALQEVVVALDLHDLILVGQDWGGPMAAGLGSRMPERVSGLVLANTSVLLPSRPRGTAFHRFARLPLISDLAFRVLGFPLGWLSFLQADRRSIRGPVAWAYRWPLRRLRDRAGPLGLARMVPDAADHPSVPSLQQGEAWIRPFAGRVALVWGEKDPLLGRALRRHVEALPAARVTRTQAGHFLQEEVPQSLVEAIAWVAEDHR